MKLSTTIRGHSYSFTSVKDVLAKANEEKSGDTLAKVGALSDLERIAAKHVLSELTLEDLRNNPVVPYEEDEVTRVIDDQVNETIYADIKNWSVGELREYILKPTTTNHHIRRISNGLTSEMVAGCAKLMGAMDLILGAQKIEVVVHANNTIGLPGTLGSRLQPNHPTDDIDGILASAKEGLAYGCGDAVIGVNPCIDSPKKVTEILKALEEVRLKWDIPTQLCVLAHVTTQMEAIKLGAPTGLTFQSLAGSEAACKAFGINVAMLDEAYELSKKYNNAAGPNVMYFETGQGSELSSNGHHGADQTTLEARCYGLAKRYSPFMVNSVVGFIGPEYLFNGRQVIRAGLEDHFMGKLTGISMGLDSCYTNHMDTDQSDIENLAVLLTMAGINFFMCVPMGDDIMLNYQLTSFHDIAALREICGKRPAPEFEQWLEKIGLMENGRLTKLAGDASFFDGEAR